VELASRWRFSASGLVEKNIREELTRSSSSPVDFDGLPTIFVGFVDDGVMAMSWFGLGSGDSVSDLFTTVCSVWDGHVDLKDNCEENLAKDISSVEAFSIRGMALEDLESSLGSEYRSLPFFDVFSHIIHP